MTSAVIAAGLVAFSTNRPVPAPANTCATNLGEARGYFVNLFNGSGAIGVPGAACGGQRSSVFVGGGLPPSPVLATVNVGGQIKTIVIDAAQEQPDPVVQTNSDPFVGTTTPVGYHAGNSGAAAIDCQ